jgi:hypothetical protein
VEVLALTDGDVTLALSVAVYLCNKRRGHVIENVVLSTWEKYHNYEKNEEVRVMSTTVALIAGDSYLTKTPTSSQFPLGLEPSLH